MFFDGKNLILLFNGIEKIWSIWFRSFYSFQCRIVSFIASLLLFLRKVTQDARIESYDNLLHKNIGFNNPGNVGYLGCLLGIGNENHSNVPGLR